MIVNSNIITYDSLLTLAQTYKLQTTAVVNPNDYNSLKGAITAATEGLIYPLLCGSKSVIQNIALKNNLSLEACKIIDCIDEEKALATALSLCVTGEATLLMKGNIHTDTFMAGVIKKENGLRGDKLLSHIFALNIPSQSRFIYVTDAAINIAPTLEKKEKILHNAIDFLIKTGIARPKVAIISATESVLPNMASTVDAQALSKIASLKAKADVEGPLAFDNIISKGAARLKRIKSIVAGEADLILVPTIEAGNILVKCAVYLANAQVGGVVLGAKIPIILTSRADNVESRIFSTILACIGSPN
ncbi:Phosphate acetyltransferase [Candidatus Hepatincolaceae symbiont of Richtersius coronifer]